MKGKKKAVPGFYKAFEQFSLSSDRNKIFKFLEEYKSIIDNTEDWVNRWEVRSYAALLAFEDGRMDYLMVNLIWMAAHWESNPIRKNALKHLSRFERYIDVVANFEEVSDEQAELLLDTFERWSKAVNYPENNLLYAKMRMYQRRGKGEPASTYKEALLALEAKAPSAPDFTKDDCDGCYYTRILQYYTDLGMTEAALKAGAALFDGGEENYCYSSPRSGAAYLLDGLIDAEMGDHPMAARAEALLRHHFNDPFPAPLRVVVPLLRFALWKGDWGAAATLITSHMRHAETATDTWYAWKFFEAASRHPEFDGVLLMAREEGLRRGLER